MDDLKVSITQAFEYCSMHSIPIPLELHSRARNVGAVKAAGDLAGINMKYHDTITEALTMYFEGGNVTGPRNAFRVAMSEAFYDAFYLGWADGGQEPPIEADALNWLNARISQEGGYIYGLFAQIKDLRKEEGLDYFAFVSERADGYTRTVTAVYNAAKMYAARGKMLIWRLGNTEKHCGTCAELNGNARRASWYLARNYIPRQPGASMLCGGYYCDCRLEDAQGNEVTI